MAQFDLANSSNVAAISELMIIEGDKCIPWNSFERLVSLIGFYSIHTPKGAVYYIMQQSILGKQYALDFWKSTVNEN